MSDDKQAAPTPPVAPQPGGQSLPSEVEPALRPLNAPIPKAPKKPELEDTHIIDIAGNISVVKTVKGERPKAGAPLGPHGSRVATKEEIDAYKAAPGPGGSPAPPRGAS